mgnify:CR=1 FL=1
MKEEIFQQAVLDNGIRFIHRHRGGEIAHVALMMGTGSRDEAEKEEGMAHCIEHMMFKGTTHRRPYHILTCLDCVGGDLNAFTTKEETCVHASFLAQHYKRACDLIADLAFNATFPEAELVKEKEVILDEVNSYKDTPSEEIYDMFEDLLFENHSLGHNILGSAETVGSFTHDDIVRFRNRHYSTRDMVVASTGDLSFNKAYNIVNQHFSKYPDNGTSQERTAFVRQSPKNKVEHRDSHLAHCIIGGLAPDYKSGEKLKMVMLNNILGGPGMNSRLSLNIREKYGFAYTIESQYNAYSDTGLFCVYMGVAPDSLEKAITLVHKELDKLKNNKLGVLQMAKAKQQLSGQLALGREYAMHDLLTSVRSVVMNEPVTYMDEVLRKIDNLSADDIMQMANQVYDEANLNMLVFK